MCKFIISILSIATFPTFTMGDNFFYSMMPPHWNLCEQRQDNWQDKENWKENPQN